MTEDELLEEARERYAQTKTAYQDAHDKAREDIRFLIGEEQWDPSTRQEREDQGRPTLTINHMPKFVNQVEGDLRQNKVSAKVAPREDADEDTADVYEGLIRTIEDISDAGSVYASAGVSAASCGMGYFRLSIVDADEETFDKELRIKRLQNPYAVLFDPASEHETCEDARFCFVLDRMPKSEFERDYPDVPLDSLYEMDTDQYWCTEEEVTIAEYWTCTEEKYDLCMMADGSYLPKDDVPEEYQDMILETRQKKRKRVEMRLITGNAVLEKARSWPGKRIPVFPVWGREVHTGDHVIRKSVIRDAKDAQRLLNYARSAEAEAAALSPKVPYLVSDTMIEGREAEWNAAHVGNVPYLTYKPDPQAPGGAPKREMPPQPSAAMFQLSAASVEDMKNATGIFDASLGAQSNETSGRAIEARQREGDIGTYVFLDNLRRAIRACASEMIALIPVIYDTPRQIRILGADMQPKVVAVNQPTEDGKMIDLTRGKYDLSVTTGASFGTRRQESVEAMTAFIQSAPNAAPYVLDIIARNSDWPGANELEERLKKLLPPEMLSDDGPEIQQIKALTQQVQELQMAMQQMAQAPEMRKANAEAAEAEADVQKTQLEVQEKAFELAMQRFMTSGQLQDIINKAGAAGAMAVLNPQGSIPLAAS